MPSAFQTLSRYFTDNDFNRIESHPLGIRFLKLRSISRKSTIEEICLLYNISIDDKKPNALFEEVFADVIIKHEEHGHINVPAGCYEVGIVKEFDHFANEARAVQD